MINEKRPLHFLLIRFSSLGDVLLATSAISMIRQVYGEQAKITFLTWDSFLPLLQDLEVNKLGFSKEQARKFPKRFFSMLKVNHKLDPFDFIWDLQASILSFRVRLLLSDVPSLVVDKRKWERTCLLFTRINFYKKSAFHVGKTHHTENLWNDFAPIFLKSQWQVPLRPLFPQHVQKYTANSIIFLPSAAHPLKKWPLRFFVQLMSELDKELDPKFIFHCICGPNETEANELQKQFSTMSSRKCLADNSLRLDQSLDAIKKAKLIISNDTGLMHQAWIHDVPLVAIFGPTIEDYGFAPFGAKVRIASSKSVWCRPCSVTGSGGCLRFGSQVCMKEVTPTIVKDMVLDLWGKT